MSQALDWDAGSFDDLISGELRLLGAHLESNDAGILRGRG